jgi:hypothetical protein
MPGGTNVTVTTSNGTFFGASSYTVDNTIFPSFFPFSIQEACDGVPEVTIQVKVITPKGNEQIVTASVTVP